MRSLKLIMTAELMRKLLLQIVSSFLTGILLFIFIFYSETTTIPGLSSHWKSYFFAGLGTTLFSFMALRVDKIFDRLIQWKSSFLLRFASGLASIVIMALIFFTMVGKIVFPSGGDSIMKLNILSIILVFIYEIFYGLFYSYHHYAVVQAEQLQSDRWQLELQFESLKNQISPHYLFNCLNTVSSLLYKDTRIAEEFIRRMADTFRYVLKHQKQRLVTVREELEFVKAYYFLLQVRFEYHLMLEINVPESVLDTMIPPMTLQLLMENAVKHNVIDKDHPLMVYVSARDNTSLLVHNTKTSPVKTVSGFRVGLDNIRKRYSYFTPSDVVIRDADRFTVELPVLKLSPNHVVAA